jgi:glutamate/tyrosine decarboxylase-like PLP-dependent enzyme
VTADDEALGRAFRWAESWLASLPDRPVARPGDPDVLRAGFVTELSDEGVDAATVIDQLATAWEPGLVATGGPRFFGFVTGGALPAAMAADWLVSAFDQNAAVQVMSPSTAVLESITASWVLDLLGLPAGSAVGFVTGGQMANLTCLAAARHALLTGEGWDVEADGLAGAPVPQVVLGARAHSTVLQALRLLGFGSARARRVPTDDQGRMLPAALRSVLAQSEGPVLVCAQAGEVNTGAVDPLDAVADVVGEKVRAWLHVDGAFGLWGAASPERRPLLRGVERADSWAVDAHKWLNVPYDCGMAIVRDPTAAAAAMTTPAAYLAVDQRDPSVFTPESSRRARAAPVYAALRSLGRRGVAALVERCCARARQAAALLAACEHVEVLNEVVLNQVLFRVHEVDTATLHARVQDEGVCWIGGTTWDGRPAVRLSVSNWRTGEDDIERAVASITEAISG